MYQPSDRAAVLALFDSNVGEFFEPGEREGLIRFLDDLSQPGRWYWVLDEGGVKASGGCLIDGELGFVTWGIVTRDAHGRGYGSRLLRHRLDWFAQRPDVLSVFCDTTPMSCGFYAKHGFVEQHRQVAYWEGRLDLVTLEITRDGRWRTRERLDSNGRMP